MIIILPHRRAHYLHIVLQRMLILYGDYGIWTISPHQISPLHTSLIYRMISM